MTDTAKRLIENVGELQVSEGYNVNLTNVGSALGYLEAIIDEMEDTLQAWDIVGGVGDYTPSEMKSLKKSIKELEGWVKSLKASLKVGKKMSKSTLISAAAGEGDDY